MNADLGEFVRKKTAERTGCTAVGDGCAEERKHRSMGRGQEEGGEGR